MANPKTIPQLPYVGNSGYTTNDIVPFVNYDVFSGTTKHTLLTDLKDYFSGSTVTITGGTNIEIVGSYPDFGIEFTGTTSTPFTGGTVSGSTEFTNGLTANTLTVNGINITGDTYVTGGTYYSGGTIIFDYNTGSNFQVTGLTEDLNNEIAGLAETDEETIELNLTTNKIQLKETVASATGGTRTFQGDFAISGGTLNLDTIGSGSPVINLGLDSSGFVVTGITGGDSYWSASTGTNAIVVKYSNSLASGDNSLAEGLLTTSIGANSHSEGNYTTANGFASHAEGQLTTAQGDYSHSEGYYSTASGFTSHAEGFYSTASGVYSHAEGAFTIASDGSHAEGVYTTAIGAGSHAEGNSTTAIGNDSHAEGFLTAAIGNGSHAEGFYSTASGDYSHAEGGNSTLGITNGKGGYALGIGSHAEGLKTTASGNYSHAEGYYSTASGEASHSGGNGSIASGTSSFIHSTTSIVLGDRSVVLGGQNITGSTDDTVYVPDFVITKSASVPTTSGDTVGEIGSITWDDTNLYVKTSNGWGKIPLDYSW